MTSAIANFRDTIRQYLDHEPKVAAYHDRPQTKKIRRYMTASGVVFAHEYNLQTVQHLWVPATAKTSVLKDEITFEEYPVSERNTQTAPSGRTNPGLHSNVNQTIELRNIDLIRFTPDTGRLDMVKRIVEALL